jgi:endoglycosylceramidase
MRAVMRTLLCLTLTTFFACGGDSEPVFSPLHSDGTHLRDDQGRVVLLRGVNARVEGVFDVTFDDGRVALQEIPALGPADCARMRQMGLNLLRLPINWSGVEPEPGAYDDAYLDRVAEVVQCAADAGVFVIVDLHQDAYSKHIGEDGAPLWAIVPEPEMLLEGPLDDLDERRTSRQVMAAFDSFFHPADAHGLQAAFIDMLEVVARRFADHPMVIGFEIFNEPVAGADVLYPFQFAAAEALRRAAPDKLVFFEPPAVRNLLDFQPLSSEPFPVPGAVYSPHVYTLVMFDMTDGLATMTKDDLRPSIDNARAEATAWRTPLFIGEFGIGPDMTNADLWMRWQSELHDEYFAANAFWLWKEVSQGHWGVHDRVDGVWVERPQVVRWLSRVYPQRIAGTPVSLTYDGERDHMHLVTDADGPHEVYVSEALADDFAVRCNGDALAPARDPATGLIEVRCTGALEVGPAEP